MGGFIISATATAACSSGDSTPQRPPTRDGGDEVVVGVAADEFGLQLNRHRLGIYPLNASICEPPFRLTQNMTGEPWLVTKSEYRGDNTFRLSLRRDVLFHDGTRLNAQSVKETLERSVLLRTQFSFLSDSSIRIIDDSTLELKASVPNLKLLDQLVHPTYGITAAGTDPVKKPVCTGPFKFVEYVPNDHITVERFDGYWGKKARLNRLTFRFIPDDNTRALALRAGEVDAIYDVNRGMVNSLKKDPGINVVTSPIGSVMLMYIALHGTPPFTIMSDPSVRRAVAMAIDQRLLVSRVLDGYAEKVATVNPPITLGAHAGIVYGITHDPAGAKRLLDSAGWTAGKDGARSRRGQSLELLLISQAGAVDKSVTEFVQAQLAQIGIRVRIEQMDAAAWESKLNSGRFDLDIEIPNQNDANPAFLLALRWYSRSNVRSAVYMFAGTRFDSLVAASLGAPDRNDAQRFAAEAMHELVDNQVGAIPLAGLSRIYALNARIHGFEAHPSRASQSWNSVWVSK